MRPKVLIVDDHEGFRSMARALLEANGFDVVGEAADACGARYWGVPECQLRAAKLDRMYGMHTVSV